MAEVNKTGLIPASSAVTYKENFRISDNVIGKYISLDGSKTFHNPGIGLDLSTPSTESVVVTKKFQSFNGSQQYGTSISGGSKNYKYGFLILNSRNTLFNEFVGVGLFDQTIRDMGFAGSAQSFPAVVPNIDSLLVRNDEFKLLSVTESGTYNLTIKSTGSMNLNSPGGGSQFWVSFYIRVNGVETKIGTTWNGVTPAKKKDASLSYSLDLTRSLQLVQGDYVQVYAKILVDAYYDNNVTVSANSTSTAININLSATQGPSQTYFSNPQNIPQMNIKGIKYYGNQKDSLKLIGNKLTS